jgi:uncharacterized protein (DUF2062 family)
MSLFTVPHRRVLDHHAERGKIAVWHPIRSLKKLLMENSSPEQLAAAGGLGVLLGALPLIGFHTIAILFAAGFLRLNKLTAVSASQLCMPPLVPALCIEAGYFFRHGRFLAEISMETLGYQGLERCYEWLIGSLLLGPLMAVVVGAIIYLMALFIRRTIRAAQ